MQTKTLYGVHAPHIMRICTDVKTCCADKDNEFWPASWHGRSMGMASKIKEWLETHYENQSALGRLAGVVPSQIGRLYKGQSVGYEQVAAILEAVGARIVFPDEQKNIPKDVCWVDVKRIGAENGAPQPHAESYVAVPLAEGPVAAGPGMVPQDGVKSWVLVFRDHPSVRFRSNLVAVEIDKGQESMEPLLHPQDIILVDKDDFRPEPDGQIFLVRDPDDAVAVKRVYVQKKDGEIMLNLVSDNPNKRLFPPMLFNLRTDYGGDLRRAIIGKCVWAWSDITRK